MHVFGNCEQRPHLTGQSQDLTQRRKGVVKASGLQASVAECLDY